MGKYFGKQSIMAISWFLPSSDSSECSSKRTSFRVFFSSLYYAYYLQLERENFRHEWENSHVLVYLRESRLSMRHDLHPIIHKLWISVGGLIYAGHLVVRFCLSGYFIPNGWFGFRNQQCWSTFLRSGTLSAFFAVISPDRISEWFRHASLGEKQQLFLVGIHNRLESSRKKWWPSLFSKKKKTNSWLIWWFAGDLVVIWLPCTKIGVWLFGVVFGVSYRDYEFGPKWDLDFWRLPFLRLLFGSFSFLLLL